MKAFYDSEADALQFHFTEPPRAGYAEDVEGDGSACFVLGALKATAAAAQATPMRYVTVEVGELVPA